MPETDADVNTTCLSFLNLNGNPLLTLIYVSIWDRQ